MPLFPGHTPGQVFFRVGGESLAEATNQSWEERRQNVVQILESIANDVSTPRNIR
ncbi:MAG: hypothetical protein DRN65_03975, partial [Thaumarchaeota archaeon]